jgi:methanogenic corrinoid protein MtbC1
MRNTSPALIEEVAIAGIADTLAGLNEEEVYRAVREQLNAGTDPMVILNECRQGMYTIGERYKSGDYFPSELIVSGEILKESMKLIEPHLQAVAENDHRTRIVIGGGVVTEFVQRHTGADAFTDDGIEGVEICKRFIEEMK